LDVARERVQLFKEHGDRGIANVAGLSHQRGGAQGRDD
jgi:hypothetical protein